MTQNIIFEAEYKNREGKGEARKLRKEEKIPAVVYGGKNGEYMIAVGSKDFLQEYNKGGIRSKLISINIGNGLNLPTIKIDNKNISKGNNKKNNTQNQKDTNKKNEKQHISKDHIKLMAIVRDVQIHPVTDYPVHIDFQEVSSDTLVRITVRIKVLNESVCPGVKKGGVLVVSKRKIDCMCYPEHIPACLEIDVSSLEIGKSIHINDIKLSDKIKPLDKSNFTILSIAGQTEEEASTVAGSTDTTVPSTTTSPNSAGGATASSTAGKGGKQQSKK